MNHRRKLTTEIRIAKITVSEWNVCYDLVFLIIGHCPFLRLNFCYDSPKCI